MELATDLQIVTGLAVQQLDPLWDLDWSEWEAALLALLPPLVDEWSLAAAAVAADWYDEQRRTAGVDGRFAAIVKPLDGLGAEALAGWATEPLRQPVPDVEAVRFRAAGGLQKRVANAANTTITDSAIADPKARGYQRKTRAGACTFCQMVASRGAVYTASSSRFACHEHCHCVAVPCWSGRELPVKPFTPSQRDITDAQRAQARQWIRDNL